MADDSGHNSDQMNQLRERLLAPPRLTVASDLPLDHDSGLDADSFDLGYRLGPTYDILRNRKTETPLAIAIRGEWGVGKTSAMRWLEARFGDWNNHVDKNEEALNDGVRIIPVWFYPWKYQDREDVWRGLLAEVIVACLEHNAKKEKEASAAAVQAQIDRLSFLGGGLKRLLKATKLQVGSGPLKATLDGAKLLEDDGEETETSEADYLNTYEAALERWIEGALGDDDRMVIFIDDLDRCLPEVALQVLEALKLYFNIKGVAFVLGIDRTVIDQLVRKHYDELGVEAVKSAEYLDKMFQVEVALAPSHREAGEFFEAVVKNNASWAALGDEETSRGNPQEIFRDVILDICRRSPREIKRLVNITLISAEGVEMSTRSWGDDQKPPTLAQGGQVALIQRVLQDRYPRHARLVGDSLGNDFFTLWSDVMSNLLEANPSADLTCNIPENILAALDGEESNLSREEAIEKLRDIKDDHLSRFVDSERYFHLLRLLTDQQLAELIRIPFSSEAAETVATDIPQSAIEIVDDAIARQIGKPTNEITTRDRQSITNLELHNTDIDDLRHIANLNSLQRLGLSETQVTDLAPLQNLNSLQTLGLSGTQVTDLAPLQNLNSLQTLDLSETQVTDLAPLQNLNSLQRLYLRETQVTDLAPLQNLNSLEWLDLSETQVTDLAPLQNLNSLQELYLSGTQVTDLAPLLNLNSLQRLGLSETQVTDLAPLQNLNSLEWLGLNKTQVTKEEVETLKKALPALDIYS